jgi:hypothetical protein
MTATSVIAEARVRARNQFTLPDAVVQAGHIAEGERFAVVFDAQEPDLVQLRRIRPSYAGALRDVYGDPKGALEDARQGWG